MEYFIYNNTEYTVSVPDVHYNNTFESGAGGSFGTTNVFRIEPHSWNTTRRCKKKGNVIVCTREEYEIKTREQASSRLESSMGISGQEKEAKQDFGFLNKVVKRSTPATVDINDFIVGDVVEEEDVEVVEEPVKDDRITTLETEVASMKGALNDIVGLLKAQQAPKKSVKKTVKKAVKKTVTKKKTNVQNKHRK